VPFFFIYYPALLFVGPWSEILLAAVSGGIGVVALAAALEGYWLRTATWLERGFFIIGAFCLINPGILTDIIGLMFLAAGLAAQKIRRPDVVTVATV